MFKTSIRVYICTLSQYPKLRTKSAQKYSVFNCFDFDKPATVVVQKLGFISVFPIVITCIKSV